MNEEYLFSRRFKGEEYKFYRKSMNMKWGRYSYFEIDTPANCFEYVDHILFDNGNPYTMYRYCPAWILKACKQALIKQGYKP